MKDQTYSKPSRPTSPEISSRIRQVEQDRLCGRAAASRGAAEVCRARLSPAALSSRRANDLLAFYRRAARARTGFLTKTRSGTRSRACSSRRISPIRSDLAEPGPARGRLTSYAAGEPAELFPLVEHAGPGAVVPCRRRRPARDLGAGRANAADAARRPDSPLRHRVCRELAGVPPLRRTQRRRSRAVSEASPTSFERPCTKSRFASSSTS